MKIKLQNCKKLETFPVDNGWAAFIIFLFGDPHLLEGGKRSQDGSSDPYRVFPLRGSNDLDLNGGWSQGSVGIQVLTDINITLHDAVIGGLMDTAGFHSP